MMLRKQRMIALCQPTMTTAYLLSFLGMLIGLFLAINVVSPVMAGTGCGGQKVTLTTSQSMSRYAVYLINVERRANDLAPLKLTDSLTDAAAYHVDDMLADDYFKNATHDRVRGELVRICGSKERMESFYGEINGSYMTMLTGQVSSADKMVEIWFTFTGARSILLQESPRQIGLAQAPTAKNPSVTNWNANLAYKLDVFPVIINNEAIDTDSKRVELYVHGAGEWDEMRVRNAGKSWGAWQRFNRSISWDIAGVSGENEVQVELRRFDTASQSYVSTTALSDSIIYDTDTTAPTRTPRPTARPTRTPRPTTAPTRTSRPTARPTRTPRPTTRPTTAPTRTPRPTTVPTRTPRPTATSSSPSNNIGVISPAPGTVITENPVKFRWMCNNATKVSAQMDVNGDTIRSISFDGTINGQMTASVTWEVPLGERVEITFGCLVNGTWIRVSQEYETARTPSPGTTAQNPAGALGLPVTYKNRKWNYAMGYAFTPKVNGYVYELGGYFDGTKIVRLFDKASGTELAKATVTAANNWSYKTISNVRLTAGTEYMVVVYLAESGGAANSVVFPIDTGNVTMTNAVYGSTQNKSDAVPTGSSLRTIYGIADIGFTPD